VDCSGVGGNGLGLVKEALVDGGGGVDGRGLDRNAWVVREGGGGLDELGYTIWPRKGSSDSHLFGFE
jgi:hypothetical protein